MMLRAALLASFVFVSTLIVRATDASAAGAPTLVTALRNPATASCLDVSTTDPGHYFLDTYGTTCDGLDVQKFVLVAVGGAPAHTYRLTSRSTGQCMISYRFGIRQGACSSFADWTFTRIGTGRRYHMEPTYTVSNGAADCIRVAPAPSGYPGTLWDHTTCQDTPDQTITTQIPL